MSDSLVTIIAGSRTISDASTVRAAVFNAPFKPSEIVSGGAQGVDSLGEEWAMDEGIDVTLFEPDYEAHPPQVAPLRRNESMAEYADALIAVWDGESSGTEHMITTARNNNLNVYVHRTDTSSPTNLIGWTNDNV